MEKYEKKNILRNEVNEFLVFNLRQSIICVYFQDKFFFFYVYIYNVYVFYYILYTRVHSNSSIVLCVARYIKL